MAEELPSVHKEKDEILVSHDGVSYCLPVVGETGRKFGVRLQEHRTEVEAKIARTFTRSQRVSSLSEHNKSALTDHAAQQNHMINWSKAMVIDRDPERFSRWIKEAVHIRKEGQHATNRDD